jgi:putative drug exporter of the RND superfamily
VTSSSPGFLYRTGRWSASHPLIVAIIWIGLLVGATAGHRALGGVYSDNFSLPSNPAQQGANLLRAHHAGVAADGTSQVVFAVGSGSLARDRRVIDQSMTAVRALPDILAASNPLTPATTGASGRIAYSTLYFSVNPQTLGPGYVPSVNQAVAAARGAGVNVSFGGLLGQAARPRTRDGRSELIGVIVAIIILLIGFGSVYAAGLPVFTALVGAFAGVGVLGMVAAATTFATVSPTLAVMMGLGVGIDYAVFLTTRHRQLVMDGADPADAAARSLASSGPAVAVAAVTVVIALLGLYASGITFIGKLGLAAGITVAVAALSALTFVPAMLGLAGRRIDRRHVRPPVAESAAAHDGWLRYAERLGAHPWRYLIAGLAVLAVLAIPLFSLQLGHIDDGADPAGYTDKQAYDAIRTGFGAGANGPLTVVARLAHPAAAAQRPPLEAALHAALAAAPDVASVSPVRPSRDGALLVAVVLPRTDPQSAATDQLMHTLQDHTLPAALARSGGSGYVTGLLAVQLQFRDQVASRLPLIIATVIAAAFVLLLLTFRSPVLALKAAVLNLFSIGAAYGVVVAVFQWGWGSAALGVSEKVPIESYVPMMMFAIVFGLSMDYEVFLLSRVREAWLRTHDNHASVAHGLAATARVISCAALIMTSVFLAFLLSSDVIVKMLALGFGASVLIDASVIRLVVVPATMFLLRDYNWWTPRWLDASLPGRRTREPMPELAPRGQRPEQRTTIMRASRQERTFP